MNILPFRTIITVNLANSLSNKFMKKYVAEFIGTTVSVILGCSTAMLVGCDTAAGGTCV